jgi:hypothetical protein
MEKPSFSLAVVMQRRLSASRWQSEFWEPLSVLAGYQGAGEPRLLVEDAGMQQWLHPGFTLELHRDEAEGYYLNVSAPNPRVFVFWRLEEERQGGEADGKGGGGARGVPLQVTVSFNEAGRWLDGGHSVDGVAMPPEVFAWTGEYVEQNYRPEPKKRIKPRSFVHPKDRVG